MIDINDLLVNQSLSLLSSIRKLDEVGSGFLIAIDNQGALAGVLTDGDIRRALIKGFDLGGTIDRIINKTCVHLPVNSSLEEIRQAIGDEIHFVPLLDGLGRPVDYASANRFHRHTVTEPLLDGNEAMYVEECIRTGWISSQGRFVPKFEAMMAEFHDVAHALAVSNGTVALQLALETLGVGPGDEVIVPDLTFAATASAVIHVGALPVFVDVDPVTWVMNAENVIAALTSRTKALIPVHLYGFPCDMSALEEIAQTHSLHIIEDCAESLGAMHSGRKTGTFGSAGCFSFYGNKTVTTGEGGMVLFQRQCDYDRAKCLRDHGMSKERKYWHEIVGHNFRLTNLQAAIGVAQMEKIEKILTLKQNIRCAYGRLLAGVKGITLPPDGELSKPVCWLYTLLVEDDFGIPRDEVAELLLRNGIDSRPAFCPLHQMPAFRDYAKGQRFEVSDELSRKGLSLPSAVTLQAKDIDYIAAKFISFSKMRKMKVDAEYQFNG